MTPVLVTPPASKPVTLADAKEHMHVDHDDDDAVISGYIDSAVSYLDAQTGILGRAIMPQTWRVSAPAGEVVLPMPDVTAASVDYGNGPVVLDVTATAAGPCVTLAQAGDVTFTCAMPAHLLPSVRGAILVIVAHRFNNRESDVQVDALVSHLRWRRI